MKNLKFMSIDTIYIGRYVTKIWTNKDGDIYQCDGLDLDDEGMKLMLKLKFDGYELAD